MSNSERFSERWLPLRVFDEEALSLRERRCFIEFRATSKRLFDSPLFAMRRTLNVMGV